MSILRTATDCRGRHAWARLYPNKLPLTANQINNNVLPTFEPHPTKGTVPAWGQEYMMQKKGVDAETAG